MTPTTRSWCDISKSSFWRFRWGWIIAVCLKLIGTLCRQKQRTKIWLFSLLEVLVHILICRCFGTEEVYIYTYIIIYIHIYIYRGSPKRKFIGGAPYWPLQNPHQSIPSLKPLALAYQALLTKAVLPWQGHQLLRWGSYTLQCSSRFRRSLRHCQSRTWVTGHDSLMPQRWLRLHAQF